MLTSTRKTIVLQRPTHVPQRGTGEIKGNPTRCLICRKEIQSEDVWLKYTSPSEPDLPTYSILVHEECERRAR